MKKTIMRNQPAYHLLRNTTYALKGMVDLCRHETSFKVELILTLILLPVIAHVDVPLTQKLLMFLSIMGVLIAETINSSIERVVDLVTTDYHPMAGRAKDVGSAIVFLSIMTLIATWAIILFDLYSQNLLF